MRGAGSGSVRACVYHDGVRTEDFDYTLPEGVVAQRARPRGTSRLLVLDRRTGGISHRRVTALPSLLRPGDVLLLNDTKVIPARLGARRATGRRFEVFLLEEREAGTWEALVRPSARAREGERLQASDGGVIVLGSPLGGGRWTVSGEPVLDLERIERLGEAPLPPYIRRPEGATAHDRERYQTVFAARPGAVAAPTAGLHLTPELLEACKARGVETVTVTLHVGIGTFRPVTAERVEEHEMHTERYEITPAAAGTLGRALAAGRRIVCVGTTTVRTLEAALASGGGIVRPGRSETALFIRPGYRFLGVGAMMTNFHLPRSTLLMLVSAFAGRDRVLAAYAEALERGYRFFSYGDAMMIV